MYIVPKVLFRNGYAENQTFKIHNSLDFRLSFIARRIFRCGKTPNTCKYIFILNHMLHWSCGTWKKHLEISILTELEETVDSHFRYKKGCNKN